MAEPCECEYSDEFSVSQALRQVDQCLMWSLIVSTGKAQDRLKSLAKGHLETLAKNAPDIAEAVLRVKEKVDKEPLEAYTELAGIKTDYEKSLRSRFIDCIRECARPRGKED